MTSVAFVDLPCDICGRDESTELMSMYGTAYHECRQCGLIYLRPMIDNTAELNEVFYTRAIDKYVAKIKSKRKKNHRKLRQFAGFKKTGRFGCSQCYQVFRSGLDNLLEAMHRNTEHHGKVPTHFIDAATAEEQATESFMDISELNAKLDEAISIEDYEEAARLRDSIAQLENPSDDLEKDQYKAE
ncbi:MAG: UvrB/UvrC motif-containing protein [Candidatus Marinimicrobia bacterium]|nr:UvrB/UvrC motif-containing protein [Candidatus Neomarinimicrobiota bacterium]